MRSFQTNARNRSLTTGTFNRVVKDRIAFRLSGANSVQANPLQERIRLSSKPYKHTVLRKTLSTRALHRISTRFPQREFRVAEQESRTSGAKARQHGDFSGTTEVAPFPGSCSLRSAQRYGLPLRKAPEFGARFFSHARAEDRKGVLNRGKQC